MNDAITALTKQVAELATSTKDNFAAQADQINAIRADKRLNQASNYRRPVSQQRNYHTNARNNSDRRRIECYRCGGPNHLARHCLLEDSATNNTDSLNGQRRL